ncbi:MAG: PstS family phosphate ABC transporter substrate-binding protein [Thainema sp.]
MASKNETPVLIAALLITVGVIGGAGWWLYRSTDIFSGLGGSSSPSPSSPATATSSDPTATIPPDIAQSNAETLAQVEGVPQGLFNYGGSTTWAPMRGTVDPLIETVWPRYDLRYVDPTTGAAGSSTGIEMLLDGQLSFAQSSRPLEDEEYQRAEQRGFNLSQIPVALEGIAFAVNPSLPVDALTLDQIQQIYTGEITNWSQVGGPSLPITPLSRSQQSGGTVEFFQENVLGGAELSNAVRIVSNTTQALRQLAETPGGIYYASAPEVVGQCTIKPLSIGRSANQLVAPYQAPYVPESDCPARRNQLNQDAFRSGDYPLTRQLFVIVKQDGQTDQQAGEAYAKLLLSEQGQELVQEAGFVRLK